ncbi:MAG: hypothetical protein WBX00_37485, partial [Isosphaeraceae bacterium]
MNRPSQRWLIERIFLRHRGLADRRRSKCRRLSIEGLEDRTLLSTITWNTTIAPNGGNWDSTTSWQGGVVPTAVDDAVITLPSTGSFSVALGASDSVRSLSTSGPVTLKLTGGSLSLGTGSSTFGSPVELTSGVTLNVATGASVFINTSQTIAVDAGAAMTVGAASVVVDNYNGGSYGISVGGTLTATGTSFTTYRGLGQAGDGDGITALSGGHVTATGTHFNWDSFNPNNRSMLNPGDLSNDTFQTTVYAPGTDVPLLAGPTLTANKSFQDVDIIAGS